MLPAPGSRVHHVVAPLAKYRVAVSEPDQDFARDQRMTAKAARQRANPHAVKNGEQQRLHALALVRTFVLPPLDVGVVGQAAHQRERVVDVAGQVIFHQHGVAAARRRHADLLRSPVEINSDLVARKLDEGTHRGMRVEQALAVRVASGCRAEWKQARTIAAVAANRNSIPHQNSDGIAQRLQSFEGQMQLLVGRMCACHHAEGITVQLQRAGRQMRPLPDASPVQPVNETFCAPRAVRVVDWLVVAVARIVLRQQRGQDAVLVLLRQIPQRHVHRNTA